MQGTARCWRTVHLNVALWLGERVSPWQMAGCTLVLLAVALAARADLGHAPGPDRL